MTRPTAMLRNVTWGMSFCCSQSCLLFPLRSPFRSIYTNRFCVLTFGPPLTHPRVGARVRRGRNRPRREMHAPLVVWPSPPFVRRVKQVYVLLLAKSTSSKAHPSASLSGPLMHVPLIVQGLICIKTSKPHYTMSLVHNSSRWRAGHQMG